MASLLATSKPVKQMHILDAMCEGGKAKKYNHLAAGHTRVSKPSVEIVQPG
jgi:hypothetical protein